MNHGSSAPGSERFLDIRGVQYCLEESGTGPAILLAHGMWCDAGMFVELARQLSASARVLVPDLRAHGRTAVPDQPWTIADLADDLRALLDALSIDRVVLVGFSMGGMAAVEFALRYPDRLAGLALFGTSAGREELWRLVEIKTLAGIIDLAGVPRFLPQEASRPTFSRRFRRDNPREITRWESVVRAMSRRALVQALRAVAGRIDHLGRLGEVQAPTVIAAGAADRVVSPEWSRRMQRALPAAELTIFPGAGHAIPTELPGETAELVRGLLPASG